MEKTKETVFQKWLWEPGPLRLFVAALIFIPSALAAAFYPFIGTKAFWILAFASIGFVVWIVYGIVGKRVRDLRSSLAHDEGEPVHSLIVNGWIQSPGIAVLKEEELLLVPVVGESVAVPLSDIRSVRETVWYNGSLLFFKKGFWLDVQGRKRVGVAVSDWYAGTFRRRIGLEHEADAQDLLDRGAT